MMKSTLFKVSIRRFIAVFTALLLVATVISKANIFSMALNPDEATVSDEQIVAVDSLNTTDAYSLYMAAHSNEMLTTDNIVLYEGDDILCSNSETHSFQFAVTQSGLYELELTYASKDAKDTIVTFKIDGNTPFYESSSLSFPSYWVDGESYSDNSGNVYVPEQVLYDGYVNVVAKDYSGQNELPYRFALQEGEHSAELLLTQGSFSLKKVQLLAVKEIVKYDEWLKQQTSAKRNGQSLVIEAESAALKNNRSLIPLSETGSPLVSPSDPIIDKLNYIGGSNWERPGLAITWEFDVEVEGYYSLAFLYRQNGELGSVSYRELKIDGQVPFEEAKRIKFPYESGWKYMEYSNDEPYLFYLSKGPHDITLTVSVGEIASIYTLMREIVADMGDFYIDMTMVIGETVDPYRSYELFNMIPDYDARLNEIITNLQTLISNMKALQDGNTGSNVSSLQNIEMTLKTMQENKYSAHQYKSSFYDSYTNISAMMGDIVNMPLDIDRIFLIGEETEDIYSKVSFWNRIVFSVKRFISSFTTDYTITSNNSEEDELVIWVSWGRDQTQALNSLIQSNFVPRENIPVRVEMVNATLVNGILSGSGPDVMLQMGQTDPVNYAMRGALVSLSQFDDLEEVSKRFVDGATTPFEYNGEVYAIPDTMSHDVMFVRTDIMQELGLKIPQTWDEFIYTSTVLQRNNLKTTLGTVAQGTLQLHTQLLQNNLSLYNEDLTGTALTEPEQIQVFSKWVGWYTKYKMPTVLDFYNYFRLGSAPIGIASYTMITQLQTMAPEIEGRWIVAPIPGTQQEDGTINRSMAGGVTGCAITKLSSNPENAWKFLKWWTEADTQLKYSNSLESVLGALGRMSVANNEAFNQQHWGAESIDVLREVRNDVVMLPELPGGYYLPRGIYQAFWMSQQGDSPEDSMLKWGTIVDNEIARKIAEYQK